METDSIRQRKITGDVEIEEKLARTLTGITWQISRLADSWQGKQVCDSRFGSVRTPPVQKTGIPAETGPIVSHVVQISICASDRDVEGSPRSDAPDGGELKFTQIGWQVERAGENKPMSSIRKTSGSLTAKVSRCKCVGSIHNAIVGQMREGVGRAEQNSEAFF